MPRSFRSLPADQVLCLAMSVETRNAERFRSFQRFFDEYDVEVSKLFGEMADEEITHRDILERIYNNRFYGRPCAVTEEGVDEVVEAVDVESAEHQIFDDMTRRDVLEAALKAENGARDFYSSLLPETTDPELRQLYQQLSDFEADHVLALHVALESLSSKRPPGLPSAPGRTFRKETRNGRGVQ